METSPALRENRRMDGPSPIESKEAISERLKLLRIALGPSQAVFCARVKIATNTWNNYERCVTRISLDEAMKVARKTNVGLDWIYRGEEATLPSFILDGIRKAAADIAAAPSTIRKSAIVRKSA